MAAETAAGSSGGGQQRESGGGRQRESGGGARQRESGGGGQRSDAGARQQDSGRAQARAAQPRDRGGDRDNGGRREAPPVVRENAPPPPRQQARTESAPVDARPRAQRRFPNASDRNVGDGGNVTPNRGGRGNVARGRTDGGNVVRGDNRVRTDVNNGGAQVRSGNARVAVPRVGPPPRNYNDRYERNVYGSYYGGRAVYGRYAYHGSRNIYIVPYGRTYAYYPRYYYNPYAFGYGPAGRGHFYFDLHYSSYIWHPYSVYRNDSYGSYGYPIGQLRLKVHPRDAQVFIDGYYAGRVDDFDGVFQSLRLEEGEYQVEIVLAGVRAARLRRAHLPWRDDDV